MGNVCRRSGKRLQDRVKTDDDKPTTAKPDAPTRKPRISDCPKEFKNYCLNNGTCQWFDELGSKRCRCPKEFFGIRCETRSLTTGNDEETQRQLDKDRTLIIVGIVTGVLVFIVICIASFFLAKRRKKQYYTKREERRRAKLNDIPHNSYRALGSDDIDSAPPTQRDFIQQFSRTTSGTQTENGSPGYRADGGGIVDSVLFPNSRTRLTASSGIDSQQRRPKSAAARFVSSNPDLQGTDPNSNPPPPHRNTEERFQHDNPVAEVPMTTANSLNNNSGIISLGVVTPPTPGPETGNNNSGLGSDNGSFSTPKINLDIDLDSDTESNASEHSSSRNVSLHIDSDDEISEGGVRGHKSEVFERPSFNDDSLNHNGELVLDNDDNRKFSSDSTFSSTPSSQSNSSVRRVAPPNGDFRNNWEPRESPPFYVPDDTVSYPPFPVMSQSDPALSSGRANQEPLYIAHQHEDQYPIVL